MMLVAILFLILFILNIIVPYVVFLSNTNTYILMFVLSVINYFVTKYYFLGHF